MERLTYEIIDGGMVTDKENIKEFEIEDGVTVYAGNAVFRLSAYEDIDLTPEQIRELKYRDTAEIITEEESYGVKFYSCPICNEPVHEKDNFCCKCGQRMKREERRCRSRN